MTTELLNRKDFIENKSNHSSRPQTGLAKPYTPTTLEPDLKSFKVLVKKM